MQEIEVLFKYLRDIVYAPDKAYLDIESLPDEFHDLGEALHLVASWISETRSFSNALSKGDLNAPQPSRDNEIASPLKSLQAALKHITWQTRQVAKGDYKQQIGFMGEFSDTFNEMVSQLEQRRVALEGEMNEVHRKIEELEQFNDLFEAVTQQITQRIAVIDIETGSWLFSNFTSGAMVPPESGVLKEWVEKHRNVPIRDIEKEITVVTTVGVKYFSVSIVPLTWKGRMALTYTFSDVSDGRAHLSDLENMAYRDSLTSLHNRQFGMSILTELTNNAEILTIVFADMDNLKFVNDNFGHIEGDRYIRLMAKAMTDAADSGYVVRVGGDEFMLLLPGVTFEEAREMMEKTRDRILAESTAELNDSGITGIKYLRSFSYGIYEKPAGVTTTPTEALTIADERMYEYKRSHKAERQSRFA